MGRRLVLRDVVEEEGVAMAMAVVRSLLQVVEVVGFGVVASSVALG